MHVCYLIVVLVYYVTLCALNGKCLHVVFIIGVINVIHKRALRITHNILISQVTRIQLVVHTNTCPSLRNVYHM